VGRSLTPLAARLIDLSLLVPPAALFRIGLTFALSDPHNLAALARTPPLAGSGWPCGFMPGPFMLMGLTFIPGPFMPEGLMLMPGGFMPGGLTLMPGGFMPGELTLMPGGFMPGGLTLMPGGFGLRLAPDTNGFSVGCQLRGSSEFTFLFGFHSIGII
jgi:hypothetical protein